jgi:preprotein translocase subunit Sss1
MNENMLHTPSGGGGEMEERLWNYIDGTASADEKTVIEKLLESNAAWKAKYHELMEVNSLLQSSELEMPSMRFTKNVMEEIGKLHIAPATKTYINKRIIWGIGIFFITLIVGFIIYGIGQVNWSEKGSTNIPVDLSKVNLNKVFSNSYVNVFMMVNVVLGLFLLDRYLANKRKKFRGEEA